VGTMTLAIIGPMLQDVQPMRSTERDDNSVIRRAFLILDAFVPDGIELGLAELVKRTKLPKATAHRLACQLVELGALEKVGERYRPGMRLFELGAIVERQRHLRDTGLPLMEDLYEGTHETVHLGIRDEHDVLYLEKIAGRRSSAVDTRIGARKPLYCTAIGKALLAFSPSDVVNAVIAGNLVRHAPRTITSPALLLEELKQVAETGSACDHEEYAIGISCVAAPVLDLQGHSVAAISLTGPSDRFDPQRFAPAIRTAARTFSRVLADNAFATAGTGRQRSDDWP
jgi:IclR family transcriptional regulator, acetate operon repressor